MRWRLVTSYTVVALAAVILWNVVNAASGGAAHQRWRDVVAWGAALAGATLAGYAAAGRFFGPVQELADAARRVAGGHLEPGAYLAAGDELGELATALHRTAEVLRVRSQETSAEKERLAAVLEYMDSGVLLIDSRGRVVVANPAARRLLDLGESDVDRPHIEVTRNFQLSQAIDQVLRAGGSIQHEFTLVHGGERHVEVSLVAIGGERGRPAGVVAVMHDVTERHKLEQLRSDFVANVSHELRTPVTAIRGFAETLLEGGLEDPETGRMFLSYIDREARRLADLVEDLLELARLQAKQVALVPQDLDLAHLVRETVERFADRAQRCGITLRAELPPRPVGAYVDAGRIEQVLVNLLDNALKYTPAGGRVTVRLEEEPVDRVRLMVADTGAGMPPEETERIFERFYRVDKGRSRQTGGTGLGLAIVKQIVQAHDGAVWAESAPGQGATFYVSLPRWRAGLSRRVLRGDGGGDDSGQD